MFRERVFAREEVCEGEGVCEGGGCVCKIFSYLLAPVVRRYLYHCQIHYLPHRRSQ